MIVIVGLIFVAIHVWGSSGSHGLGWDESVYIGMAKWLGSAGELGLYEPIRPLALPFLIAYGWILGLDPVGLGLALELIAGLAALVGIYELTRSCAGQRPAVLATVVLATTPVFFFSATDVLTEVPSLAAIVWALVFVGKQRSWAAGLCAGLAVAMKFPNMLLLALLIVVVHSWGAKWRIFAASALLIIPHMVVNLIMTESLLRPLFLAARHGQNMVHAIPGTLNNLVYYPAALIKDNPLFLCAVVGGALVMITKGYQKQVMQLMLLQGASYLAYFTWIPNKQLRFALLFIPMFVVLTGVGIDWVSRKAKMSRASIVVLAIIVGAILVVSSIARYARQESDRPGAIDILREINGPILTTDPIVAVDLDKRFIPFYFFVYDEKNATQVFEEHEQEAQAVVWWPQAFACDKYPGRGCEEMVGAIERRLNADWRLILDTLVDGGRYQIYKK